MLILANLMALALTATIATAAAADEPRPPQPMPLVVRSSAAQENPKAEEVWPLTLPEAIRIGLDNSEVVRVISTNAREIHVNGFSYPSSFEGSKVDPTARPALVIARLNADASSWNFKAAVMAHVRSIEQQYWALSQLQVTLWSRETAVCLGEEILTRERAELKVGHGAIADVAEAEQQLENFKLNLISATSDLITTERQLRNILGLPASDNRRIVPSTAPTEAKVDPSWDVCVREMNAASPDIAQQRHLVRIAELKSLIAAEDLHVRLDHRQACRFQLERQQGFLQQIVKQSTHSLSRFFLEVDANYRLFQTAQKLRAAGQQRLEAQRAFYKEGRVTIDRLLDAVSQYSNAIAQEAQYKAAYNSSLAALEEAKGTLLEGKGIIVADPTLRPSTTQSAIKVDRVIPASFDIALPAAAPAAGPAMPLPTSTTYKLRAKMGLIKVLDIEFEVNQNPTAKAADPAH